MVRLAIFTHIIRRLCVSYRQTFTLVLYILSTTQLVGQQITPLLSNRAFRTVIFNHGFAQTRGFGYALFQ